jgi:hypothetical protein
MVPHHVGAKWSERESDMPSADALAGLIKWLRREPWDAAFGELLERHLGPACDKAGVPPDELGEVLGEHWAMTLWGCAFEDFLTREIEGAGNIVDDYLKRRGWNEKTTNKAYLAALRSSVISLYEASGIRPGESFLARDLIRGGEPVRVSERTATHTLKPWDRLAARLVEMRGKTTLGGGVLPFEHELSESLIAALGRIRARAPGEVAELIADLDIERAQEASALVVDATGILRLAGPLVSTYWLNDTLQRVLSPAVPRVFNSDGEDMEIFALHYRLENGVTAEKLRAALSAAPDLDPASATFWNWLAPRNAPRARMKLKGRDGLTFSSMMAHGATVLGTLELKGRTLTLQVNSKPRAERGRAMLEPLLEGLVATPLIERQTLDQALAEHRMRGSAPVASGLPADEERRLIHAQLDRHYRQQLDEPLPMLGNVSPRKAAKTAKGRVKIASWLKFLENRAAQQDPGNPMADYDLTWLWQELGVADLRQ